MNSVRVISACDALELMSAPELFSRIGNDKCTNPKTSITFDDSDVIYGCFNNGELCGVVTYEPESSVTVNVHCNFIESKRKHAHSLVKLTARALFREYPTVSKVNACVPVCYPDVIGFCRKFGLVYEGIDRKSILKGGKLIDRMRLGATRDEIERLL